MAGTMDSKSAEELSKSIQAVKDAAKDTTEAFEEQLRIVTQMRDVMSQISGSVKDLGGQQGNLLSPENIKSLAKELDRTSKSSKGAFGSIDKLNNLLKNKFVKTLVLAEVGLKGFTQGFMGMLSLQKGIFGFFGGVASGLFNIGKSILAIPFKVMDGLFSMAKRGGNNELRAALEEVRDLFGDLKSESAMAVQDVAYNMGKFDKSGVTSWQIFGNLAERMKAVTALAKGLGATFQVFQGEIDKNGEAIMRYQRGLGLTDEMMGSIASNAIRMGKGIEQVQNEMTKQALGMSKAFGVNAKVISRDMGKAMQDLAHFGHLSTKELGIAATFANKLGISVDKLTSMMDATKTFDQAAEGMSKLNEQYGTNIDATKMMMAQSPAEKFALISKGFRDAGKDLSKLTYQDREFIKAQAGMTDEALNAMIANKDAGTMFDKMSKEGDKNEKKVLSQADAMHELADSIKRLTPHGDAGRGGILKHFLDGIARGLQTTPEFMKLMRNINVIFRDAIMYGVKLGKMIFGLDNGMRGVVGGLADAFNPVRYRKMFQGVLDAFAIFKKDGVENMDGFMKKIHDVFVNFFMGDKPAGSKMLSGFKKFGTAVVAIFAGIGSWVVKELTQIIPKITAFIPELFKFIKDPKKAGLNIESSAPAWVKPLAKLFNQIRTDLWPVLKDLFNELWNEAGPYIKKGLQYMLLSALGAGALKAVINMAATSLITFLFEAITAAVTGAGVGAAATFGSALAGIFSTAFSVVGAVIASPITIIAAIGYSAIKISDAIKDYSATLEKKGFDPATAKIAAGTTGLINALTLGLLPSGMQEKIAETLAKMLDWLFKGLEKIFGPSFVTSIKTELAGAFQVFGGIGDLIKSMWNGDSKGVEQALRDICEGLLKFFLAGFEFLKVEVPLAILKLGTWVLKGIAALSEFILSKLGDIFVSFERLPIVGGLFGLIGDIFHKLGKFAGALKDFWGGVLDFLKLINIPAWFKSAGEAITNFFKEAKDRGNGFLSGFFEWGKKLVDFFDTPWRAIREMFNTLFTWDLTKSAVENLQNNFKNTWNTFTSWWNKWVDQFVSVFIEGPIKAWNWIKNNFNKEKFIEVGKDIVDGLMLQIDKIKERFAEPFKKGLGLVKTFLGIHSPSKAMEEVGKNMAIGLQAGTASIPKDMKDTAVDATKAIQDGLGVKGPAASGGMSTEEIKKVGESVKTVIQLTNLIPADNKIKNKLETLGTIFESLNKITNSISGSIASAGASESPLQKITDNLKFIFNILQILSGDKNLGVTGTSLSSISTEIDKLKSITIAKENVDSLTRSMERVGRISDSFGVFASKATTASIAGLTANIEAIQNMVTKTRELDTALSTLPKMTFPAKLESIAKGMGLGGKFAYTVQSKEVVINVEFNVTMEVDKVEQILVSRTSSIIRDRINYAIKNSAQNDKSTNNAYIKKFGPQTGFYASDVDK